MRSGRWEWVVAVAAVLCALLVVTLRYQRDHADHETDYVEYRPGTLPVVLVVAHDGDLWRPSVPARAVEPRRDEKTAVFAEELADALEQQTGRRPHVVRMRMDRRQVDANRLPKAAFEHPDAQAVYEAFHARVHVLTRQLGPTGALVLDLHGNWEFPADLYLGTDRGRTVAGESEQSIDAAMRRAARQAGFDVAGVEQTPKTLRSDHIVNQYADPQAGVEAVMVELHTRVRSDPTVRQTMARALATAVTTTLDDDEQAQVQP